MMTRVRRSSLRVLIPFFLTLLVRTCALSLQSLPQIRADQNAAAASHLLVSSTSSSASSRPYNAPLLSRRFLLQHVSAISIVATQTPSANAAMKSSQQVFKVGIDLSEDQAIERFKEGRKSLQYLLDNYDQICEGGGDNIRRYIGTVGTSSGLWGIGKVMRTLESRADDIVDFTETMGEVEASLRGADSAAYMAIFVTTSSSSTPPEKYFGDARIESQRAQKALADLASQLKIS